MRKILVIAPDRAAGEGFYEVFCREIANQGIPVDVQMVFPVLPPRITPEGELNDSPLLTQKLAAVMRDGYADGFKEMIIASETLEGWIKPAMGLLPTEIDDLTVYQTADLLKAEYPDPQIRPVWLGTTPVVKKVGGDFPTLLTLGYPQLQDLTAEIIWRTKAVTGADFQNAPEEIQRDAKDENVLREKVGVLVGQLGNLPVSRFIMGGMELPLAFVRYIDEEHRPELEKIELVNPAVILGRRIA